MANFPAKRLRKNTVLKNTHAPFFSVKEIIFFKCSSSLSLDRLFINLLSFCIIINKSIKLSVFASTFIVSQYAFSNPQKFHILFNDKLIY